MVYLWDGEVCGYVPSVRLWGLCWEIDYLQGTVGYDGRRGSKNLEELVKGDYPTFGTLIWREELIWLTLLLLTGSKTKVFKY